MKYKVISFDIFQTLVDVNKRIPDIWRGILKDEYTEEKAAEGAKAVMGVLPEVYESAVQSEEFLTMEQVYLDCAEKAVKTMSFEVQPRDVVDNLMLQHAKAPFYPEVLECLHRLRKSYGIVLSSDSSHAMVDGLIESVPHDRAFISDDLQSYKGGPNGKFFHSVLQMLDIAPEEVIHIGDSPADVLGARRAGITSCLISREGQHWSGSECQIKPDILIRSFCDLDRIL